MLTLIIGMGKWKKAMAMELTIFNQRAFACIP